MTNAPTSQLAWLASLTTSFADFTEEQKFQRKVSCFVLFSPPGDIFGGERAYRHPDGKEESADIQCFGERQARAAELRGAAAAGLGGWEGAHSDAVWLG